MEGVIDDELGPLLMTVRMAIYNRLRLALPPSPAYLSRRPPPPAY